MSRRAPRVGNVLHGLLLLARGRAAGLTQFADTQEAFLASLAPLIAFPLVGAGFVLAGGDPLGAARDFLATLCALLAPPVLSHFVAARWNREAQWMRYAVAFNWCQWAIPVVAAVLMLGMTMAIATGVPASAAGVAMIGALIGYGLWLHWFLAVRALQLGAGRAVLLVVLVNVGTGLLVLVPNVLGIATGLGNG